MPITGPRGFRGLGTPLRRLIRATLAIEGARPGEIGVVLSDDSELRALNRRWRGIDRATDVLSFPYPSVAKQAPGRRGAPVVSGDLVISLDRTVEQARRYRVSVGRELARLVVHGTLHLAGHDHHAPAERGRMRRAEAKALRGSRDSIAALDAAWRRTG